MHSDPTIPPRRRAVLVLAAVLALAVALPAPAHAEGPAVQGPAAPDPAIDTFVGSLRGLCATPPARRCTRAVHAFLDRNGDGAVAPGEILAVRDAATAAVQARESLMTVEERSIMGIALLGVKYAGPDAVFANFDADGDGGLAHDELFADFRLDGRSFAAVVEDRDAVDWVAFGNRFGKVGKAFVAMLPPLAEK